MVRMAVNPIGSEDDLRPMGAQDFNDLELVRPGHLNPPVGHIQHAVGRQTHDPGRIRELPGPDLGAPARAHLPAGEDDHSGFVAQGRQGNERAAAGQLDVVGMRPERQSI